jgi:hypothetical protein
MKTVELTNNSWPAFCKSIEATHRNTLLGVQQTGRDGQPKTIFDDQPLQSFVWQHRDRTCSDALLIEVGSPGEKPAQHQIIEPIRMILRRPTEDGRFQQLEIVSESGTAVLTFHPGLQAAA